MKYTSDPKKQKIYRMIFNIITAFICVLCITGCIFGLKSGIFISTERFAEVIQSFGILGHIVFVIIETISVVILIIPCALGYPAATIAFGPFVSFVLNGIATVVGSIIIFVLVRAFGKPIADSIVSKRHFEKYEKLLEKTSFFEKLLTITFIMPFLPDNVLCYLAGLTKMSFKRFLIIVILFKPWKILFYTYGVSFSISGMTEILSKWFG